MKNKKVKIKNITITYICPVTDHQATSTVTHTFMAYRDGCDCCGDTYIEVDICDCPECGRNHMSVKI